MLAFVTMAGAGVLFLNHDLNLHSRGAISLTLLLPLFLGVGIAAIQLIPTAELIGYTVRSGVSGSFVTSYSLPLDFIAQFLIPFVQGEPSEATGEYHTFIGFAAFALLLCTLRPSRSPDDFYFVFALAAFSLALGELNPFYSILTHPTVQFFARLRAFSCSLSLQAHWLAGRRSTNY
jgi:hypothetical protein